MVNNNITIKGKVYRQGNSLAVRISKAFENHGLVSVGEELEILIPVNKAFSYPCTLDFYHDDNGNAAVA